MSRLNKILLFLVAVLYACLFALMLPTQAAAQPVPAAAHKHRADLTRAAHSQWGLNAPIAALAAQVHQESGWNPSAISPVGARGLTQFMPATATWWCAREQTSAAQCQPHNPTWALRSMVGYDKYLYDMAPSHYSPYNRLWVGLRAYNGGMGHWQAEAKRTSMAQPTRLQVDAACGTARRARVHCTENLHYPQRILQALQPRYAAWGAQWVPDNAHANKGL